MAKTKPDARISPEENKTSTIDPATAKTVLGRKLAGLRAELVADGEPLLDWSELERETASRRGENEANIH